MAGYAAYTVITAVPSTSCVYTDGGAGGVFGPETWEFSTGPGGLILYGGGGYTYVQTPVPPSALLLASGLIPLAWARRKKRLGK